MAFKCSTSRVSPTQTTQVKDFSILSLDGVYLRSLACIHNSLPGQNCFPINYPYIGIERKKKIISAFSFIKHNKDMQQTAQPKIARLRRIVGYGGLGWGDGWHFILRRIVIIHLDINSVFRLNMNQNLSSVYSSRTNGYHNFSLKDNLSPTSASSTCT